MKATEILTEAEALGLRLIADGPWLRVRPKSLLTPTLLESLRRHKAEILDLLSLRDWPDESLECVCRTGKLIARFLPLLGQPVATPDGTARLLAISAERIGVVVRDRRDVSYFLPGEVRPPEAPAVAADIRATVH